jgi:cholest-4-en-3-one 26-monooxygenase
MMVAVDMAPPAHMVISAVLASRRSSSCKAVVSSRAPVLPTGCPMAIAPPLTLTRSGSGRCISAEIDGHHLSDDEFGFFVLMLAVAGNETTRNAIAHGMLAFLDHPGQWETFKASRPETAADEIVRWATPITVFQRTATQDTTLGGQEIKAGQRLGLFYRSANFDEEVFDEPDRFDIGRDPNPHLGYGGYGTHYCLGANLAKLEIELIFNAIADAMPDIAKAGAPVRLRSGWINGIKSLPVSYRG